MEVQIHLTHHAAQRNRERALAFPQSLIINPEDILSHKDNVWEFCKRVNGKSVRFLGWLDNGKLNIITAHQCNPKRYRA